MTPGYTCIDSFCGAGGLALGLQRAGFEILVLLTLASAP
jgi:site-specific DNA-cytosine methylase